MELLCPYDPSSVIARFLLKRQEGFHHITFEVDNLDEAVSELGGSTVAHRHDYPEDVTYDGFHWREAFIHPCDAFGVLIHLAERRKAAAARRGS